MYHLQPLIYYAIYLYHNLHHNYAIKSRKCCSLAYFNYTTNIRMKMFDNVVWHCFANSINHEEIACGLYTNDLNHGSEVNSPGIFKIQFIVVGVGKEVRGTQALIFSKSSLGDSNMKPWLRTSTPVYMKKRFYFFSFLLLSNLFNVLVIAALPLSLSGTPKPQIPFCRSLGNLCYPRHQRGKVRPHFSFTASFM